ncbi:putative MFS drug transporter [Aspergillus mulundensis]|uniref:Major facilitator superfamily (MFS) profile domain-containing protein n=1 Tax=Aspergillus mulundensis TaxID=1810919 RepID=A0A3D8QZW5_9EURO|nr:hypothetical protein DSM5745_09067 [Aspergillus mulundensis]RDW67201.1 hypothetical protein DSM5745_09067 [Aspergillus mulundensis]
MGASRHDSNEPSTVSDLEASPSHVFNEQTNYVPRRTIITIFLACSTVDLIALMDQTTLAASLSIISNALHANDKAAWISGAYFVTSTAFQLLYGRLSDIWSRKSVLFTGLAIFLLGSLASSLASTAPQLIVFRAFTGIGGGGLMTLAQMIVSDVVPLRERGKYQGILGAVVAIANGIGPVIGGALSSSSPTGWRWIFRLNLPLTALATAAVFFFMPLRKVQGGWRDKVKAVDFVGGALALAGTAVLLLGLTWGGGEYAWDSAHVVCTIAIGFAVCVFFVLWEWRGARVPLVPMGIFKSGIVDGACLTMFINGWNFLVQVYYIPSFYQVVFGYGAVRAGAMLLPVTLMQTVSSTLSGLVVHRVGRYRECILFGWMVWAVGLGLFSTLDENSGVGKQIGYGILTGVGVGNTLQPALIAIQAGVSRRDMAVVTSFRNFIRNLGGTLGLAVAQTIINNLLVASLTPLHLPPAAQKSFLSSPTAYLSTLSDTEAQHVRSLLIPAYKRGFRIIFMIGAALAAVAFCIAGALIRQVCLEKGDEEVLKEEGRKRVQSERGRKGEGEKAAEKSAGADVHVKDRKEVQGGREQIP